MKRPHGARLAALAAGAIALAVPAASGADEIEPCIDVHRSLAAVGDPSGCGTGSTTYDWDVDPPYDGEWYADEAAAAADDPEPPPAQRTTLPTWRSVYDWPAGDGYAGWDSASSAAPYSATAALGGEPGLWLWPTGGQQAYTPAAWAEWTFTAPGTTRLAAARLVFSYRNKLLAHHCLEIGFRDHDGTSATAASWCKPVSPPDSERSVEVALADPGASPTSKELYVRIRVDCGGAATCAKTIPTLDPLTTGGHVRVRQADLTLVDDDLPDVGREAVWYTSEERYELSVTATDAGSGIQLLTVDQVGVGRLATAGTCDPRHRTPALGSRICAPSASVAVAVDTSGLAEGAHEFLAAATDVAGNRRELRWTLEIRRFDETDPGAATGRWIFEPPVPLADALAWAAQQGVRPVELVSVFPVPGSDEALTTGYAVDPGETDDETIAVYPDFIYSQFEDFAALDHDYWTAYTPDATISAIAFRGPAAGAATFLQYQSAQRVVVEPLETARQLAAAEAATSECYDPDVAWWPASGRITTRFSTSTRYQGKRYVWQNFRWTAARLANLRCWADDPTFEADAIYYNYADDGRRHFLGSVIRNGWASNMPDAYLDTKLGDGENELVYTVGTVHARKLVAERNYWTILRTQPGNALVDRGLAQAQVGKRRTSFCWAVPDEFCIFAEGTAGLTPRSATGSPWTHAVPGSTAWTGGYKRFGK